MPIRQNLTGKVFNLIRCVSPAESRNGKTYWNCECIKCGAKKVIQTSHLKDGRTKTCGCGCVLNENNVNFNTSEKICEICGKSFIPLSINAIHRKYCYDCSPEVNENCSKSNRITILRRAMKKEAVKRKGGKCEICGYNKNIAALQFHHLDPSIKEFGLAQNGIIKSWEDYWQEAQKCILVCANCHAEIHSSYEQ